MTLHLLNRPDPGTLDSCLRFCAEGDAIVLMEDGVYHAATPPAATVYALQDDLAERGLQNRVAEVVQLIDYAALVALCIDHQRTLSWF